MIDWILSMFFQGYQVYMDFDIKVSLCSAATSHGDPLLEFLKYHQHSCQMSKSGVRHMISALILSTLQLFCNILLLRVSS